MSIFSNLLDRYRNAPRSWWEQFTVIFDASGFSVTEAVWGKEPIEHVVAWQSVTAICFRDGGLGSDSFFVYSQQFKEPVLVPVEANGGNKFWDELKARNLFPQEISAQATTSVVTGAAFWWPELMGTWPINRLD
jgi:hypothetical protein